MLFDSSLEGQFQFRNLITQPPLGQLGHSCGVALPSTRACNISRPETPKTSLATLASLIFAVSNSFSKRLRSADRLSTS